MAQQTESERVTIHSNIARPVDTKNLWYRDFVRDVHENTNVPFSFFAPSALWFKVLTDHERKTALSRTKLDKLSMPRDAIPASFRKPMTVTTRSLKVSMETQGVEKRHKVRVPFLFLMLEPSDELGLEHLEFQDAIVPPSPDKKPWVDEFSYKIKLGKAPETSVHKEVLAMMFKQVPPEINLLPGRIA